MRQHALRRNRPARADIAPKRDRRRDLAVLKRGQAAVMTGIDYLDPDRGGVQIAFALPRALARVPGPVALRNQLVDRAIFPDEIMRRDLGGRIEKPIERGLAGRHPGVVQDEAIRPAVAATLAAIGRGKKPSGERTVGRTRGRHEDGLAGDRKEVWRASLAVAASGAQDSTRVRR